PFYPSKRTLIECSGMSVSGQKQTHALQQTTLLFDHLIGAREERSRHVDAERLGGLEVDHEPEVGGLLDRQVTDFGTFENPIDITRSSSKHVNFVRSIGNQTAVRRKKREIVHGGQTVSIHDLDDCSAMDHIKTVRHNTQPAV